MSICRLHYVRPNRRIPLPNSKINSCQCSNGAEAFFDAVQSNNVVRKFVHDTKDPQTNSPPSPRLGGRNSAEHLTSAPAVSLATDIDCSGASRYTNLLLHIGCNGRLSLFQRILVARDSAFRNVVRAASKSF